jgi:hypothetical protein
MHRSKTIVNSTLSTRDANMAASQAFTLLCFAVALHAASAQSSPNGGGLEGGGLTLDIHDFVLAGRTRGAYCPPSIHIKTFTPYAGSNSERYILRNAPETKALPLAQIFSTIRVRDVKIAGKPCVSAAESVVSTPTSLRKLVALLKIGSPFTGGPLALFGNLIVSLASVESPAAVAVGVLLSEDSRPVKCGRYPYPVFFVEVEDIAAKAPLLASKLHLKRSQLRKDQGTYITSATIPRGRPGLMAIKNGSIPLCAYRARDSPTVSASASASSGGGTGASGARADVSGGAAAGAPRGAASESESSSNGGANGNDSGSSFSESSSSNGNGVSCRKTSSGTSSAQSSCRS